MLWELLQHPQHDTPSPHTNSCMSFEYIPSRRAAQCLTSIQKKMLAVLDEFRLTPDGYISEFDTAQTVLGTRSGYVRDLGRSVMPPPHLSSGSSSSTSKDSQIALLKKKLEQPEMSQNSMQAQIDQLMASYTQMSQLMQQMNHTNPHIDSPEVGQFIDGSHTPRHQHPDESY